MLISTCSLRTSKHIDEALEKMIQNPDADSDGLSDHSFGISAPIAAVAFGATFIEKHFTFSKYMYGSDAENSMEHDSFCQLSLA